MYNIEVKYRRRKIKNKICKGCIFNSKNHDPHEPTGGSRGQTSRCPTPKVLFLKQVWVGSVRLSFFLSFSSLSSLKINFSHHTLVNWSLIAAK